jgi:hypothetical protein
MKFVATQFLSQPRHSLLRQSVSAALIAAVGSCLVLATAYGFAHLIGKAPDLDAAPDVSITTLELFGLAVFSPLIETVMLALTITVLAQFFHSRLSLALVAALVWAGLHSIVSPFWFFGTVWSFFVFSWCYLMWRPRSLWHALAAAAIPHALVNISVFAVVALAASA